MSEEYKPYGKEWESEIMKLTKQQIVDLYRIVCIRAKTEKNSEKNNIQKLLGGK